MDGAVLLGTRPVYLVDRAVTGAKLYAQNRIGYFVYCGAVSWEFEGELLAEAEISAKVLMKNGVPADKILLDKESTTTKENMICATLQLARRIKLPNMRRVTIVTSASHVRRSVALAKRLFPRITEVFGCLADSAFDSPEKWQREPFMQERLDREIGLLRKAVLDGLIEDISF
ncbi:MAG: YdcF family protein [Oscillospiraceae bacterium]|nr:YdcF family protein [Oscillospiraceae bacterium]